MAELETVTFREQVLPGDAALVRGIVASTGFFHEHEIAVAVELVEERLSEGPASGYHFLFAERGGRTVGYSCFGEVACTPALDPCRFVVRHVELADQRKVFLAARQHLAGLGGD